MHHRLRPEAGRPGDDRDVPGHLAVDRERAQNYRHVAQDPLVSLDRHRSAHAKHFAPRVPGAFRDIGTWRCGRSGRGGRRSSRNGRNIRGGRRRGVCRGLFDRGRLLGHGRPFRGGGSLGLRLCVRGLLRVPRGVVRGLLRGRRLIRRLAGFGCGAGERLGRNSRRRRGNRLDRVAVIEQRPARRLAEIRDPQDEVRVGSEGLAQFQTGHRHAVDRDDPVAERDHARVAGLVDRRQSQSCRSEVHLEALADGGGQRPLLGGRLRLAGEDGGGHRQEREQPCPERGDDDSDATAAAGMTGQCSLPALASPSIGARGSLRNSTQAGSRGFTIGSNRPAEGRARERLRLRAATGRGARARARRSPAGAARSFPRPLPGSSLPAAGARPRTRPRTRSRRGSGWRRGRWRWPPRSR